MQKIKKLTHIKIFIIISLIIFFWNKTNASDYVDSEYFTERVNKQELPKISERLPVKPRIINLSNPGKYGGEIMGIKSYIINS